MVKNVPEGTKLMVDSDTGLPQNLGEIMVRLHTLVRHPNIERRTVYLSCFGRWTKVESYFPSLKEEASTT